MKKRNRETRDLVLAMSIGDGCITSSGYLSFIHGKNQKEYLEWKIWLLHKYGITTTKVSAALTSIANAKNIAPKTINGERKNRRSTMFTPDCT